MPPEGKAEVPLVIERDQRTDGTDPGAVEDIDAQWIAQFFLEPEGVVSEADALV